MARRPEVTKHPLKSTLGKLKEQQRVAGAASRLILSGIQNIADGVSEVIGTLQSQSYVAGESGWQLTPDQFEVNDILLRGGIIGNDALTSPVTAAVWHAEATNFTLTSGANQPKATATVTVPAGYSRAMVTATAMMSVLNNTSTSDYLYVAAYIQTDSTIGFSAQTSVAPGNTGSASQTATALLTGLADGAQFTVKVAGSTNAATYSSGSYNSCNIDATVLFLR